MRNLGVHEGVLVNGEARPLADIAWAVCVIAIIVGLFAFVVFASGGGQWRDAPPDEGTAPHINGCVSTGAPSWPAVALRVPDAGGSSGQAIHGIWATMITTARSTAGPSASGATGERRAGIVTLSRGRSRVGDAQIDVRFSPSVPYVDPPLSQDSLSPRHDTLEGGGDHGPRG